MNNVELEKTPNPQTPGGTPVSSAPLTGALETPSLNPASPAAGKTSSVRSGTPASTIPSVFDYLDYREFLEGWFRFKKAVQPGYSAAVFSKKAGIGSHSFMGMVIRGERNLSSDTTRSFARALDLNASASRYFERLVLFTQARNPDDRAHYLQQLTRSAPVGHAREELKRLVDFTDYTSSVEHVLVRELVACADFREDAGWMEKKLRGRFSRSQCEKSWKLITRLGYVELGVDGKWVQKDPKLLLESGSKSPALSRFVSSLPEFTRQTIATESHELRDLGSLVIAIPQADFQLFKKRMQEFRHELHQTFPISKEPADVVVAVGLQLIQTTQSKIIQKESEGESS
jgi:uncharacterized protein (TIGR02147 family)